MSKNKKILFMIYALTCFIAIGVCLIVDLALTRTITWSGISIASIILGWCITLPLFLNKFQLPLSLAALSVLTFPFLWYLARVTSVHSWFPTLGVTLAAIGVVMMWLVYLVFRFFKIHILYRSAISVFITTVIASPIINHIVASYTFENVSLLNDIANIFGGVIVTAVLVILGYTKTHPDVTPNQAPNTNN